MKHKMLDTDNGLDILCELTPYAVDICTDERLITEIKNKIKVPEGADRTDVVKLIGEKINKIVPIVLKEKKESVCGILAVLNGVTVEDVKKQSVFKTMRDVIEILNDEELVHFFNYCTGAEKNE